MQRIRTIFASVIRVTILMLSANLISAAEISFRRDLAPVLVQKCQICHGAKKAKGGYRVDTFERLLRAGDGVLEGERAGRGALRVVGLAGREGAHADGRERGRDGRRPCPIGRCRSGGRPCRERRRPGCHLFRRVAHRVARRV